MDTPTLPEHVWMGWLEEFRQWVSPTTNASLESIFAAGLLALSCGIGRSCSLNYGGDPLYCNLYVVIVGRTAVARKTTVLKRARVVLERAFTKDWLRWSKTVGSAEGLLELFCNEQESGSGKNKRLLLASIPGQRVLLTEAEFTGLIAKMSRPATANLLEILMTLYDGDDYKPHTRSRPMDIQEPFFSILTATTPTMLDKRIDESHLTSGFLPRFAFFAATPRPPKPYPPMGTPEGLERLTTGIQQLSQYAQEIGGTLELSPDAKRAWEPIYIMFEEEQASIEGSVGDLLTRITALAMKVALIYALMNRHRSIYEEDLHAGVSVARYCSDVALGLSLTGDDRSRGARLDERILGHMDGVPVFVNQIHKKLSGKYGSEEVRRAFSNLALLGRVDEEKVIVGGRERVRYTKVSL